MEEKKIVELEELRKLKEEYTKLIKEEDNSFREDTTTYDNNSNGNSNEQGKVLSKSNGHSTLPNSIDSLNQRAGNISVLGLAIITFLTEVAFLVIAYLMYK